MSVTGAAAWGAGTEPAFTDERAASGPGLVARVEEWEGRIRRALLVAHAVPPLLGLAAVLAIHAERGVRAIDVLVWALVVVWSLLLLVLGWRPIRTGVRLAPWILADAAVMAALAFIGTPAREVVNYAAIDGALFASVFVSARLALGQVGIVYAGLAAAALARAAGSSLPSPPIGWFTPLLVTLAGVIALRFLGRGLAALREAVLGTEAALARRRALATELSAREAAAEGGRRVVREAGREVDRLVALAERHLAGATSPEARAEGEFLQACARDAQAALAEFRTLQDPPADPRLGATLRLAVRAAVAPRLHGVGVELEIGRAEELLGLSEHEATAVTLFAAEALNNAAAHGRPPIELRVLQVDGRLQIEVADGGPGFDAGSVRAGLGLANMAAATELCGGELSLRLGAGHVVALTLPPRP